MSRHTGWAISTIRRLAVRSLQRSHVLLRRLQCLGQPQQVVDHLIGDGIQLGQVPGRILALEVRIERCDRHMHWRANRRELDLKT